MPEPAEADGAFGWAERTVALERGRLGVDPSIMHGLDQLCPDHAAVTIAATHQAERLIPIVLRSAARAALLRDDRVSIALCADGSTRLQIIPGCR